MFSTTSSGGVENKNAGHKDQKKTWPSMMAMSGLEVICDIIKDHMGKFLLGSNQLWIIIG
ncbi:MAG TPA: hypothetical protein DHV49_03300 [Alphaproteobacteria bacterium]|nr:hypothetical protein [Alphaproteobacteria bacterium]